MLQRYFSTLTTAARHLTELQKESDHRFCILTDISLTTAPIMAGNNNINNNKPEETTLLQLIALNDRYGQPGILIHTITINDIVVTVIPMTPRLSTRFTAFTCPAMTDPMAIYYRRL